MLPRLVSNFCLASSNPPTLASQNAGITGISHCAGPRAGFYLYLFSLFRQGLILLFRLECSGMIMAHCLNLLDSSNPISASAETKGMHHYTHTHTFFLFVCFFFLQRQGLVMLPRLVSNS